MSWKLLSANATKFISFFNLPQSRFKLTDAAERPRTVFFEKLFIGCSNKRTTNILLLQRKVFKFYYCLSFILSSEFRSSKTAAFFTTSQEPNQRVEFLAVLNAMEQEPNVDAVKMK